ncbi:response regulator transcription factor [Methylorubrum sp. SB2]|uniref:response regulator transcription factor n=1 Tax=Methylorubrum subtropicum TaxID=3138812 RepID=UPI00313D4F44
MSEDVTILLVDDHPVVREGYRRLLERQPGHRVVAEAETAADAYKLYKACTPTIVIMDWSLPGPSGLEGLRHIRQWDKQARILVFSMHQNIGFALKALEAGACAYVTKSSPPAELVKAIRTVLAGGRALSEDMARAVSAGTASRPATPIADLSPREVEILHLVASGLTTEAIAEALNLSTKTVQNKHYGIKAKIGARTDAHLVWLAMQAGLVSERTVDLMPMIAEPNARRV